MSKNMRTPRDELVCGKLDRLDDLLSEAGNADGALLSAAIRHDCERMEAKLVQRKDEVLTLERQRDNAHSEAIYYRVELEKAHTLLGRVVHQTSERWDSVRLTKFYPTDNLNGARSITNPTGGKKP